VTEVVYTDAAERDLTQISLYIAADNPRAAIRFLERLRPDVHPDIRSLPHESYIVFFDWNGTRDEVRILRIWHGSRKTPTAADLY
jgi:plasmid stabilization system protein ParE